MPRCTPVLPWRGELGARKAPGILVRGQGPCWRPPLPEAGELHSPPSRSESIKQIQPDTSGSAQYMFAMSYSFLLRPLCGCGGIHAIFSLGFREISNLVPDAIDDLF